MKRRYWTDAEDAIVRNEYSTTSSRELSVRLGRSAKSILHRARKLGVTRGTWWTEEDEQFLRDNYKNISALEISLKLGRSMASVWHKALKLGLGDGQWSQSDVALLIETYSKHGGRIVQNASGRSLNTIREKAVRLGLTRDAATLAMERRDRASRPKSSDTKQKHRLNRLGTVHSRETIEKMKASRSLRSDTNTNKGKPRDRQAVRRTMDTKRLYAAARISGHLNLLTQQLTRNGVLS